MARLGFIHEKLDIKILIMTVASVVTGKGSE